ncbi:peptidase S49 [Methylobacterium haplocladii]|uniref:Peptidase S49 n=1 Tax=Methylobacterium haplocladii TaxID=1176176 RepID=A0A512IJI1_9HYPH|nr:peptidase S49 [Methylobacterium haplocladii]
MAVLRLNGAIGAVSPIRPGLSIGSLAASLERAFTMKRISAVALIVNSPGGSAAQSHLIYRRIRALAAEKKLPVFAFVEDAAASGGYMIACAADEIIADPASLVGSIGVVSAGFGFDKLIERIGVERRVHTQGEAKAMLDPFRPEDPADVERLKAIQADIQNLFTTLVTERRPKLGAGQNLFTGAVWSGRQALALGLVDAVGDLRTTMRARFGDKVELKLVAEAKGSLVARLLRRAGPGSTAGGVPDAWIAAVEERAAWARFGL